MRRESWSAILNIIIQVPGTSRRKSRQASSQALCGHLPSPNPTPAPARTCPAPPRGPGRMRPGPARCAYRGLQFVPAGARVSAPGRNGCMWSAMVALASRRPPGLRWWEFKSLRSLGDGVAVRCPDWPRARATQGPPCAALLFPRNALLRSPTQPHPSLLRCPGPGTGGERRNDQVLGLILF